MEREFLKKYLESGSYPTFQPIVFSGKVGSGKYSASLDVASAFADEKNIFTIEMDSKTASVETTIDSDVNMQKRVLGNREDYIQSPLVQAIKAANEGEPAVVIYDLKGEGEVNYQFALDLLEFVVTGYLSCESSELEKDNASNLVIMIVKSDDLELMEPFKSRCLIIRDYQISEDKTISM